MNDRALIPLILMGHVIFLLLLSSSMHLPSTVHAKPPIYITTSFQQEKKIPLHDTFQSSPKYKNTTPSMMQTKTQVTHIPSHKKNPPLSCPSRLLHSTKQKKSSSIKEKTSVTKLTPQKKKSSPAIATQKEKQTAQQQEQSTKQKKASSVKAKRSITKLTPQKKKSSPSIATQKEKLIAQQEQWTSDYIQQVCDIFQSHLVLLEEGSVTLTISIQPNGEIDHIKIESFESEKNARYLTSALQSYILPIPKVDQNISFTILFHGY